MVTEGPYRDSRYRESIFANHEGNMWKLVTFDHQMVDLGMRTRSRRAPRGKAVTFDPILVQCARVLCVRAGNTKLHVEAFSVAKNGQ